jgi:alpha-glucoside transport system permease protein
VTTVEAEYRPASDDRLAAKILRAIGKSPVHLVLVLVGLLWMVPAFALLVTSLLSAADISAGGWWRVFSHPSLTTFESYGTLFDNNTIMTSLATTAYISVGGTILPIFVGALAGYAFAWLDFPGRDWFFIGVIALLVVPLQMALIPMFRLYNTLSIYDTLIGLILFHSAFGLPFAVFLLRNFFIGIPKDVLESARIDGASELRIFFRLILPLGLPAIASLAIFQFLWVWNDLLVALVFARDTKPITVAIYGQLNEFASNVELIAPAAFISLAIPLCVFLAFQRYFVQGLLAGSVK